MDDRTEPIRIRPGEPGRLIVFLPYSPDRVEKIKTVKGRQWHKERKHWTVPDYDKAVERLCQLFAGEQVLVDPSLGAAAGPKGEPEVPLAAALEIRDLMKLLRATIRARHFSPATEAIYVSWAERFMRRNCDKPLEGLGEADVGRFLTSLATENHVAASTQNQACPVQFKMQHRLSQFR